MQSDKPLKPVWGERQLRLAVDAARVALWSWHVDDDRFAMDERAFELWGLPWSDHVSFEELATYIHPEDRNRVRAAFTATRAVAGSYEIDFRICLSEEVRWISARGQGADAGIVDGKMFGIFLDVTGRKQAEEGSELLAGEMSHRVKNLLALATALTRITGKSASSVEAMTKELTQRLTSLDRAHDLVRPLPGQQGKAALLGDLIAILLAPYDETAAFSGRIRVAVARMGVGEQAATALALVIHELATNSIKHGSLSSPTGLLDVSSTINDDQISIVWAESGGPVVPEEPTLAGFGSNLIKRSVGSLGGSLAYAWRASGLVATVSLPQDRLVT